MVHHVGSNLPIQGGSSPYNQQAYNDCVRNWQNAQNSIGTVESDLQKKAPKSQLSQDLNTLVNQLESAINDMINACPQQSPQGVCADWIMKFNELIPDLSPTSKNLQATLSSLESANFMVDQRNWPTPPCPWQ